MKKITTLFLMIALALVSFAQVTVTINLDMRGADYDESAEDLYYSGDFNSWATPGTDAAAKFGDNGDGTYSVSFDSILPGYTWNDFYRENEGGSGWGTNGEWPGAPTGIDAMIYVGTEDLTFESKWGDVFNMSLSVNMSGVDDFDATTDTVYYINDYVGPLGKTVMTDADADGIYTVAWDSIPQGHYSTIFAYGSAHASNDTVAPEPLIYEWADTTVELLGKRVIAVVDEDIDKSFVFGTPGGDGGTGINDYEAANVSLYPNPSTGILNIILDGVYNVMIMDITGKIIHTDVIDYTGSINLSDNPSGMYFLRFVSGNKVTTRKIILE